jgi:rubredoxin
VCRFCNVFAYDIGEGDDAAGLAPGIPIHEISADWRCPVCGKSKTYLKPIDDAEYSVRRASYDDFMETRSTKMPSLKSLLERSRARGGAM